MGDREDLWGELIDMIRDWDMPHGATTSHVHEYRPDLKPAQISRALRDIKARGWDWGGWTIGSAPGPGHTTRWFVYRSDDRKPDDWKAEMLGRLGSALDALTADTHRIEVIGKVRKYRISVVKP